MCLELHATLLNCPPVSRSRDLLVGAEQEEDGPEQRRVPPTEGEEQRRSQKVKREGKGQ